MKLTSNSLIVCFPPKKNSRHFTCWITEKNLWGGLSSRSFFLHSCLLQPNNLTLYSAKVWRSIKKIAALVIFCKQARLELYRIRTQEQRGCTILSFHLSRSSRDEHLTFSLLHRGEICGSESGYGCDWNPATFYPSRLASVTLTRSLILIKTVKADSAVSN